MKRSIALWASIGLLFIMGSCGKDSEVRSLKLAHTLDASHPVHKAMVFLAEKVKEKSGGKMELEIYTSGQLGSERECLELLQIGSLAITKVSCAVMENFAPNYKALGLPYIFKSREHQYKVLDGEIGKDLLLQGEQYWLRGLCFYDAGSRSFYTTKKKVESPADLQGLKIRVMKSPTAINMVSNLGGSPTPISFGELFTALQQGVVDGAENNPPSFVSSRHYEICKYYTINEHSSIPDVLLISTKVWKKLNDQEREWLNAAVAESVVKERELWVASEKESLDIVQKAGVEVIYPDKKPFADKVMKMYDEYKSEPGVYDLIQKIQQVN